MPQLCRQPLLFKQLLSILFVYVVADLESETTWTKRGVFACNGRQDMTNRFARWWQRHESFLLVFILFALFRLLAIWLMRPGGFIADTSDYEFYVDWGEQAARGYKTFETLWTTYPPLFASLMLPVYELSARIPPWVDPRFAFHTLFGAFLLLFECGNLVLIYRLSNKLHLTPNPSPIGEGGEDAARLSSHVSRFTPSEAPTTNYRPPIHPVVFYALLFVPVYTLLGWFEAMPLFFLLLALDLLLSPRRWGWAGSAVAMGLGFLVKLMPIILLPVAVRWLGSKLSWSALRQEWFNPSSPGNLLRPALYTVIAGATIAGMGYWLVDGNLSMATSSLTVNNIRPPWQNLWALLDGYWGYGLVPIDMRNLQGLETQVWESRLPWTWITVGFLGLYLWLYTRPYDWARVRTAIAFTGISAIWMFLYSKGWSPQFLVWILAFICLLLPNLRGVLLATAFTLTNVVEAYVYLILLPNERWILVVTVVLRTVLLVLTAVEFLAQIWRTRSEPEHVPAAFGRFAAAATWVALVATLLAGIIGAPRIAQAYSDRRLAENPCYDAIRFLQAQTIESPLTEKIAMTEIEVWRNLYPWLRHDFDLRVIDGYSAEDEEPGVVIPVRLRAFVGEEEFWWLYTDHAPEPTPPNLSFFDDALTRDLERQVLGDCHVERVIRLPQAAADGGFLASAEVGADVRLGAPNGEAGAIELQQVHIGTAEAGAELPVVLYWQSTGEVPDSWTVFTQLFDGGGALVAQHDNLPVRGLAPTNTWEPYRLVRDPYTLTIPAGAAGPFTLHTGLYTEEGRATITLPDGSTSDHYEIAVP